MLKTKAYHQQLLIIIILLTGVIIFANCAGNEQQKKKINTAAPQVTYAGSGKCISCHKQEYEDHLKHFHHLTSALATTASIRGSFNDSTNRFYFNPQLYIQMEKKADSFYQVAYKNDVLQVSRPFNIVTGSGKRGQSYLYWFGNSIFQLPITYFTETSEWTNSPGYSNKAQFNRPVTSRCLECHATYFKELEQENSKADAFDKSSVILGVECEKCHGAAAEHVAFHTQHPEEKKVHALAQLSSYTREQQLDLCRLCHGGRLNKTKPSFSFSSGNKLADYFNLDSIATKIEDIDVHGNQYGMMVSSRCFVNSTMTCNTCHDPHRNQTGQLGAFTAKCNGCHTGNNNKPCKLSASQPAAFLNANCIDCHMPVQPSKSIMVLRQGESIPTSAHMRSHYITVYKEIADKIINGKKGNKKPN